MLIGMHKDYNKVGVFFFVPGEVFFVELQSNSEVSDIRLIKAPEMRVPYSDRSVRASVRPSGLERNVLSPFFSTYL